MKTIGILTITDYLNYGNRLQNYAAQELLKARGFDVTSIANVTVPPVISGKELMKLRIQNILHNSPMVLAKRISEKIYLKKNQNKISAAKNAKSQSFKAFSERHLKETEYVINPVNCPDNLGDKFDYFLVGSDQIWNPNIRYGSYIDFLLFAPVEKRIALAPSFGVSSIPEKFKKNYREWLSEMKYISVREKAGAKIILKLTGKEAPVLIDPTLMLTKEDWINLAEPARKKPQKPYLLTYFIGSISKKRKKILQKLADENNLELVMMASFDDIERYDANPGEFVDYIRSAEIICTDSFHAIIFSMQMERPFVVFDREGKSAPMSSRIETLLGKFKFENRKYSLLKKTNRWFQIDFSHVSEILKTEREKVTKFLDTALK